MLLAENELRKNIIDDMGLFHAGQLLVKTLVGEDQLVMVDPQLVKHRSVEVANVYWVLDDVVAEIVRFTVADSAFDSTASHPGCETARVMVTSVIAPVARIQILSVGGTAEFSSEDDKGVV
jgi:hypothetical protein